MTQALAQARKALENVLPTLDDLAKYRGLSYSEAQSLAVDVRSALSAIDAALEGGAAPKVKALDDDQIMEIIRECAPWKTEPQLNDLLTYEKSPPLFPQATYDVPSYRAVNIVRSVERRILSALDLPSPPTGA